jgi:hypothetical protein
MPLLGIKPRLLGHPASSQVTIPPPPRYGRLRKKESDSAGAERSLNISRIIRRAKSRTSVRGIVKPAGWRGGVPVLVGVKDLSALHRIQAGSGAHPASYTMGTGPLSAGVVRKRLTIRLHLVSWSEMVVLYLQSPVRFYGVMFNELSKGISLLPTAKILCVSSSG